MNLDYLTDDQRRSVMHIDGPLLISAGAGSGKTFTLTQRIAYALLSDGAGGIDDIEEVLAITFTDKAAGEIKARVKSTLREAGLGEQALKVDGAWISTIHGMCARILRTHALELGIDPGFQVVSEAQASDMLAASIEEVLGRDDDSAKRAKYGRLFDEVKARSQRWEESLASMLVQLAGAAANLEGGLDGFTFGPGIAQADSLARGLLLAYEQVSQSVDPEKKGKRADFARDESARMAKALQALIESPPAEDPLARLSQLVSDAGWIGRPPTAGGFRDAVDAWQEAFGAVAYELLLAHMLPVQEELVALAQEVLRRFAQRKADAFVLDNDDLLKLTLGAFRQHPGIAGRYREKFRLIMVDEFQDTSQIQIDIISYLAGERLDRLCTVGDAQQSIYRFRGADVKVYEQHRITMASPEVAALPVELSRNYRSHSDILRLVDAVFGQGHMFGDRFMSLEADPLRKTTFKADAPRVDILLTLRPGARGATMGEGPAKQFEAEAVARRFAALRDAGHEPREMVLLLGRMTFADTFAQALRDQGFETVVAGGSTFAQAGEVRIVARLLEVLANPLNAPALYEVLASDMFRISTEEFLDLSTRTDPATGEYARRNLSAGFLRLSEKTDGQECSARLRHAAAVLGAAWKSLRHVPLGQVLIQVVADSGWLSQLDGQGAAGTAVAGNIRKAIRIIEGIDATQAKGVPGAARAFSALVEGGLKEAPGALSGSHGNVVKIMTIHASKGLEFPLVALADFNAEPQQKRLIAEVCGGSGYLSLGFGSSAREAYPVLHKRQAAPSVEPSQLDLGTTAEVGAYLAQAATPGSFRTRLMAWARHEEAAEARRKLYVGMTRASEAIIVSLCAKASHDDPLEDYQGVNDDIRRALCGNDDFPEGEALLGYGGSEPARFERLVLPQQGEPGLAEGDGEEGLAHAGGEEGGVFCIPVVPDRSLPGYEGFFGSREGVFSYSSLARGKDTQKLENGGGLGQPGEAPEDARSTAHAADADKATDLGTAFHLLAQYAIETGGIPDRARREKTASLLGLSHAQEARLEAALENWFGSALFRECVGHPFKKAEMPFFIEFAGVFLEGELDLICSGYDREKALVIDYKTGGRPDEAYGSLVERHRLQAECYAAVVLGQGYQQVDLRFVRVEQVQAVDEGPQVVEYRFDASELGEIRQRIAAERG